MDLKRKAFFFVFFFLKKKKAIKDHKFEDLFAHPGVADLSSLVDFGTIKRHIKSVGNQKTFLFRFII